jgi:endo-1,4-beta-mannosidase
MQDGLDHVKGKNWFVGWFPGGELSHADLHRRVWSKGCAAAFGNHLQGQYRDIAALNVAWKSNFASFDDLLARKPDPPVRQGPMYHDFQAFAVSFRQACLT